MGSSLVCGLCVSVCRYICTNTVIASVHVNIYLLFAYIPPNRLAYTFENNFFFFHSSTDLFLASTVCLWMCEKVGGKKKGRKKMGTCIQKMYNNVHAIHINFLKMCFYQQSPLLLSEDFLAVHFSHYLEYSCHVLMFCAALWSTFFSCHGFMFTR